MQRLSTLRLGHRALLLLRVSQTCRFREAVLEYLDRSRHRTDFIGSLSTRHHQFVIAGGDGAHRTFERADRLGKPAPDPHRNQTGQNHRSKGHQPEPHRRTLPQSGIGRCITNNFEHRDRLAGIALDRTESSRNGAACMLALMREDFTAQGALDVVDARHGIRERGRERLHLAVVHLVDRDVDAEPRFHVLHEGFAEGLADVDIADHRAIIDHRRRTEHVQDFATNFNTANRPLLGHRLDHHLAAGTDVIAESLRCMGAHERNRGWRLDRDQLKSQWLDLFQHLRRQRDRAVAVTGMNERLEFGNNSKRVRHGKRRARIRIECRRQIGIISARFALQRRIDSRLLAPQTEASQNRA